MTQTVAAPPRATRVRSAAGASAGAPPATRLRYVDSLRVVAIALVFVIHVCEVFNPWDEWHVTNVERSRLLGEVVVLMAPWIMPLVMLLAGVSAWFSLAHRGNLEYLRERTVRVFFPLVAGTLLLVPVQVWLERRLQHRFTGSLWAFYPHFFDGVYPRGNLSWHHLWFLGHLYAYSFLALPLFRYLQRAEGSRALRVLARVSAGPGGVLWLALPLILERALLWGLFPERHMLTSDWSNHALLFVAYLYGFVLAGSPWLRAAIDKQWPIALGVALLGTSGLVVGTWLDVLPDQLASPYAPSYLAFWCLYAVCAWAWMIAALGTARRWADDGERVTRRGERYAYGWYIVHQPVIVAIAYGVVQWDAGVATKAAVLFVAAGFATQAITAALRRVPGIGAALGGYDTSASGLRVG